MAKPKLVVFDSLAGVPVYYARTNVAYGDKNRCTKSRKRRLHPTFLRQLNGCIEELKWLTHNSVGPIRYITSGGAYVDKPGFHSKGKAFDLGGVHWEYIELVHYRTADVFHKEGVNAACPGYMAYMAVECVLRRWFGTVLGMHYNSDHDNHHHIDPGTNVGYWDVGFGKTTRTTFMRRSLVDVWGFDIGPKLADLRAAIKDIQDRLCTSPIKSKNTNGWLQYLLLTAMKAIQEAV
jgi:hypothetical protein